MTGGADRSLETESLSASIEIDNTQPLDIQLPSMNSVPDLSPVPSPTTTPQPPPLIVTLPPPPPPLRTITTQPPRMATTPPPPSNVSTPLPPPSTSTSSQLRRQNILEKEYADRLNRASEIHALEKELLAYKIREAKAKAELAELILQRERLRREGNAVVGKLSLQLNHKDFQIGEKPSPLPRGPRGVQVVNTGPEHTFTLDEDALAELLLREDVKDRAVVVISVAGAFRKGKSFLLDFFLRYLQHKYGSGGGGGGEWLGAEHEPLGGFSWRGGSDRDTTGILMWSDIFKATLDDGEKVAIILLDTQGAFDSESTVRDCATVFALSTMLSSVQIYNLSQNIQEDDLQHLQLFTEYGRLALEDSGRTPFQRLQFLVRDWSFPYEAAYGAEGGMNILQRRLKVSDKQHPELQSLRKHITSCFSEIACFLMPHPGLKVATNPQFDGRLLDIESEFKRSLQQLVPMLLAPENLVPKLINGQRVKAKDLLLYFKAYMNIYKGNELPEPKSMLVATAEANNLTAVAEAKDVYTLLMEEVCGGARPYLQAALLEAEHARARDKALHSFHAKRKMGGDEFSQAYCEQLTTDLEEQFNQFKAHNESKNIFKAARTPSVFFALAMVLYVASGLLGLLGLYPLANLCNLAMGAALVTLVVWAYIRYSGEMREFGMTIDEVANVLWENVMKPVYQACIEKGMEQAAAAATEAALGPSAPNGKHKHL